MKRIIRGALLCAAIVTAGIVSAQKSKDMSVARGLNTFSSIVKELEMNYVDTINSETAFKDAIDAMLQTVDPYTVYYPKEDREDISQMTTGEYAGIGALLLYKDGGTYVSEPFENRWTPSTCRSSPSTRSASCCAAVPTLRCASACSARMFRIPY